MNATTNLAPHATALKAAMDAFADTFIANPSADTLEKNIEAIVILEQAFNLKATIDSAVAHAAILAHAGKHAASSKPIDFLTHILGISRAEAHRRLDRAALHYPQTPSQNSVCEQTLATTTQRQISGEKQTIIAAAVNKLHEGTELTPAQFHADAIEQATHRSPEDLRTWARNTVNKANNALAPDHTRAHRNRSFQIGPIDNDGGCYFKGYAPSELAALMEAAITPRAKKGVLASVDASTDKRSLDQRRADALWHVFRQFHNNTTHHHGGVGSIVLCMSAKDLDVMPAGGYPTNTHANLTPLDVLRLGAAKYDFALALDPDTGNPLRLGRGKRLANLEQKIALQASLQVCSHPGCQQPAVACDVHHLVAWAKGGFTDIENLTLLCAHHHSENDDSRRAPERGFADRCKVTGRVGFRSPPTLANPHGGIVFNNTTAQQRSCGANTREQQWHTNTQAQPPPLPPP